MALTKAKADADNTNALRVLHPLVDLNSVYAPPTDRNNITFGESIMDDQEAYKWAEIFNSPWDILVKSMSQRAQSLGLLQPDGPSGEQRDSTLVWLKDGKENCRWLFVNDPSDIQAIRKVFNNEDNVKSPSCFVVVKQPDPSDDRGDIIFDIFRLNAQSYLWHFNRVYTPPRR
jgi:hypothetical protein